MSTLDAVVGTLEAVSLDTLNERAALLARTDRKYLLTAEEATRFVAALPAGTRALEIDGRRRFAYASTYLDTPSLASFHATARRRPHRGKVRIRTYRDTGERQLEVKTRRGSATVKTRCPWVGDWDEDAAAFVAEQLDAGSVRLDGALQPTVGVDYQRSTLLLPHACARVTLDQGLAWSDLRGGPLEAAHLAVGDLVVVETKTPGHAGDADRALWRLGRRPVALSKYATGLAALDPRLPRNRWHRTLDRLA